MKMFVMCILKGKKIMPIKLLSELSHINIGVGLKKPVLFETSAYS